MRKASLGGISIQYKSINIKGGNKTSDNAPSTPKKGKKKVKDLGSKITDITLSIICDGNTLKKLKKIFDTTKRVTFKDKYTFNYKVFVSDYTIKASDSKLLTISSPLFEVDVTLKVEEDYNSSRAYSSLSSIASSKAVFKYNMKYNSINNSHFKAYKFNNVFTFSRLDNNYNPLFMNPNLNFMEFYNSLNLFPFNISLSIFGFFRLFIIDLINLFYNLFGWFLNFVNINFSSSHYQQDISKIIVGMYNSALSDKSDIDNSVAGGTNSILNKSNNDITNDNSDINIVDAESNQRENSFNDTFNTVKDENYIVLDAIELIEYFEGFEVNENVRFFEMSLVKLITFKNLEDNTSSLDNTLRGKIIYNLNVNRIIYNSVVIYLNLHILTLKDININKYILAKKLLKDLDIYSRQLKEINVDIALYNHIIGVKTNLSDYLLYNFDVRYYDTIDIYRDGYTSERVNYINDFKYLNLLDVDTISIENNYLIKELKGLQ